MKPSFSDQLDEILRRKVLRPTSEPKQIGNMMIPDGVLEPISVEEAKQAILEAVKVYISEVKNDADWGIPFDQGFNACRQALLERLGGV